MYGDITNEHFTVVLHVKHVKDTTKASNSGLVKAPEHKREVIDVINLSLRDDDYSVLLRKVLKHLQIIQEDGNPTAELSK